MSALKADASTSSPSRMSIARRTLPSRLELKSRFGSRSEAPLANVTFTTALYVSPVQMMPSCDQTGTPGLVAFIHFHSSTTSGSASWISLRIRLRVFPRQSPRSAIRWEIICDADALLPAFDAFMSSSSELLAVVCAQALPAAELHDLGTHHAADRFGREEPVEHVEANVPARRTPGDEAVIDMVRERKPGAAGVRLQLRAGVVAAPAVFEPAGRVGALHDRVRDHRRPDRRELGRPGGRQAPVGVERRPFPEMRRVGQRLPYLCRRGVEAPGQDERPVVSLLADFRAGGGARHVALAGVHGRFPFRPCVRAPGFLRFGAGSGSMRSKWRSSRST